MTILYIFCSFIAFHVHPRFWQVACSKMTRDENMGRFPVVGNIALLADTVLNYWNGSCSKPFSFSIFNHVCVCCRAASVGDSKYAYSCFSVTRHVQLEFNGISSLVCACTARFIWFCVFFSHSNHARVCCRTAAVGEYAYSCLSVRLNREAIFFAVIDESLKSSICEDGRM